LFSAIAVSSVVLLISSVHGFRSFYAYIGNREQIGYHFGLLHRYLFHDFEIVDAMSEGINNLNVLDVLDVVSGIAKMLGIITETLIVLLLDGLEGLGGRWMLIGALKDPDEHGHNWS
jgi:hypothetical protein